MRYFVYDRGNLIKRVKDKGMEFLGGVMGRYMKY
jgi:hypothetical protein